MTSAYVGVTPGNVVQGPAEVYWGIFGAITEPPATNAALLTDPVSAGGAGYTDFGATMGGVSWDVAYTYGQIKADQVIDPIGARLTGRAITVTMSLLEATLANLKASMNQSATINVGSGISTLDPGGAVAAPGLTTPQITQPTYGALIIDGWAPALGSGVAARRRFILRKVLNDIKATAKYDLVTQTVWACTFTCYYVSSSISPFIIEDQTA
jgi:hypothetical protein